MNNKTELFDKNGKVLSIADVMTMLPPVTFLEKVNRVEVIDQKGRSYVNWKPTNKTEFSLQDNGKTLKVFISDNVNKCEHEETDETHLAAIKLEEEALKAENFTLTRAFDLLNKNYGTMVDKIEEQKKIIEELRKQNKDNE